LFAAVLRGSSEPGTAGSKKKWAEIDHDAAGPLAVRPWSQDASGMRLPLAAAAVALACACSQRPAPTWHRDVQPLMAQSCGACHVEGGIAPFALSSFQEAYSRRDLIRTQVESRRMPPWPPGPGCSEYEQDRSLPESDRATLLSWLDSGAPEGDPADAHSVSPPPSVGLSRVDRTLRLAAPYIPVESPDEYRCFLLDWPEAQTRYITGFRAVPGNPAIVHHVLAFLATPDRVAQFQALDDADPAPGYKCFGGPGGVAQALGAWAPGSNGGDFPADTGLRVPAGSKIILQIHYNVTGGLGRYDQTAIELKVDPAVTRTAFLLPWANPAWVNGQAMPIPAGQADVSHSFTFAPGPYLSSITSGSIPDGPFVVYAAALHQHLRGTRSRVEIQRASGSHECVLDIPRWDFHWQGAYTLATPKRVERGDSLSIECHWDNSAKNQPDGLAPRDLNWGERTSDEMCLAFLYITR